MDEFINDVVRRRLTDAGQFLHRVNCIGVFQQALCEGAAERIRIRTTVSLGYAASSETHLIGRICACQLSTTPPDALNASASRQVAHGKRSRLRLHFVPAPR